MKPSEDQHSVSESGGKRNYYFKQTIVLGCTVNTYVNLILFSQTLGLKLGLQLQETTSFWGLNKCMVLNLKSGPSVVLSSNGISVPLQS